MIPPILFKMRAMGTVVSNIRLLIIEDHAAVRRALVNRLSSNPELQVEAADSLADGLKRVEAAHPDVVLLDTGK